MNVLLPGIVKRDFPSRVGAVTGFYTMMLCVGAAGAAALGTAGRARLRHHLDGGARGLGIPRAAGAAGLGTAARAFPFRAAGPRHRDAQSLDQCAGLAGDDLSRPRFIAGLQRLRLGCEDPAGPRHGCAVQRLDAGLEHSGAGGGCPGGAADVDQARRSPLRGAADDGLRSRRPPRLSLRADGDHVALLDRARASARAAPSPSPSP